VKTPQIRYGLIREVIVMAFDTVRTNKLRSGLTVLGVVIGITSIVAMTSLIRGFDASLEESLRTGLGADTIYVQRFGITSFASGREFSELTKRPVLTVSDARALQSETKTLQFVNIEFGRGPGPPATRRVSYGGVRTRPILIFGTTEFFAEGTGLRLLAGRFLTGLEIQYRSKVAVLGNSAYELLFAEKGFDPIGKTIRVGSDSFVVVGVFDKAPAPGNFTGNQDDFAIIPYTTYQSVFGLRVVQNARGMMPTAVQFSIVPRSGISQATAIEEIERVMRSRHRLRLDEPNDFDIVTQDALMQVWSQISQATFFALVVISSIALMVGGIGVMAIMSISVTERTREIGVRRALGARRREVLFQFLTEAAVLTSVGGLLGILLGSGLGLAVHFLTGFPVSLPLWSFALGIGFSATVGIVFGMYPAIRAARLDPIEALRYE
jgi:putative ABC transport system permease protein